MLQQERRWAVLRIRLAAGFRGGGLITPPRAASRAAAAPPCPPRNHSQPSTPVHRSTGLPRGAPDPHAAAGARDPAELAADPGRAARLDASDDESLDERREADHERQDVRPTPEAARIAKAAGLQPRLHRRRMRTGKPETSHGVVPSDAEAEDVPPVSK